ncbi:hypothetical protein ACFQ0B_52260 [Nonomuraea thailandensis]
MRAFAESVRERLGGAPVDALLLNAGMILPSVTGRTTDGFETTFAVNHLAPTSWHACCCPSWRTRRPSC